MKNFFFFLTLMFFVFSVNNVEAQQKKPIYFDKYPDEYSPSYIPEDIIPQTAQKDAYKNKEKDFLIGNLTYRWVEADPNGNDCSITLGYERHTLATTNYGWGGYKRDGITVKPEEAAYINSIIRVGPYLADDYEAVEIKDIPITHLQLAKDKKDPNGNIKIIKNLKEKKTIPIGYVVSFDKSNNRFGFTTSYANINLYAIISCSLYKNSKAGFHHEFMKSKVKQVGLTAFSKLTGNKVIFEQKADQ